ncbi:hypothetical protein JCM9957A_64970 [Kineosporia succinea]
MPLRPSDPPAIGRYRLAGRLGTGGMGTVYLGRTPGGRPAAIKVINTQIQDQPEALSRFQREVETLRTVRNPFTASLIDFEVTAPPFWMATEYVPGPTLAAAIKTHQALAPDLCRGLFAALAEALDDIHAHRVLHRDIKPANIILSVTGPQLIDFGIARAEEQPGLTQMGMTMGTPGYVAPEVLLEQEIGPAADVFALGATMAFAATGRAPYGKGSPHTINNRCIEGRIDVDGLPEDLASLVRDCVAREPGDRPTPQEIVDRCRTEAALVENSSYQSIIAKQPAARPPAPQGPGARETVAFQPAEPAPGFAVSEPTRVQRAPGGGQRRLVTSLAIVIALGSVVGLLVGLAFRPDSSTGARPGDSASGNPATPSPEASGPATDTSPGIDPRPTTLTGPNGTCVSVPETRADGDRPSTQPCDSSALQQWGLTAEGLVKIENKCLDVGVGARDNGTPVQLWECNGTDAQIFVRNGEELQNRASGRCLTTESGEPDDGSLFFLWDCSGGNPNQRFAAPDA